MCDIQSLSVTDPEKYKAYRDAIVAMAKAGMLTLTDHARFSNFQRQWIHPPAFNSVEGASGWNKNSQFTFHPLAEYMEEKYDTRGYYLYSFPTLANQELVDIRKDIEPYLRPRT
jgi:hypothetical protein